MNSEYNKTQCGAMGEYLVRKVFSQMGYNVKLSDNPYDSEKDMTINGKLCEVKTQQRYHLKKMLTIRDNQINKCQNADILIFVEYPTLKSNDITIRMWIADKKETRQIDEIFFTRQGRKMAGYKTENLRLFYEFESREWSNKFHSVTNSKWENRCSRKNQ